MSAQLTKTHSQRDTDRLVAAGWTLKSEFRVAPNDEPYEYLLAWEHGGEAAYWRAKTWDEQGCKVCRQQWLSRGEIPNRLGGANGGVLLYRCDTCGTFWEETTREAHEITEAEARKVFPHLFQEAENHA
ncbi:hypothetical protein [Sphingopyxis sp. Root1497]|uniref:hypothetical protein n=1 Tax=Sphingopyxis sp. Root1497 TaxID=1736474 RepID=UPI0012E3544C|nr:hypothetical protein [Sphingopyxis sp. Root1497]